MTLKYFDPTANGRQAESASDRFRRLKWLERSRGGGGGGTTIIGGGPTGAAGGVLDGSFPDPTFDSTRMGLTAGGQLQLPVTGSLGGVSVGGVTIQEQTDSLYSNRRVLLNKTAPTHSTGGNRGDGSNIALQTDALLNGSYQASPSNAGTLRISNNITTSKGSNGVRGQGAGTITSSGTAVTGSNTAFAAGDADKKINAVSVSGGAYTYYTATLNGAPASATSLTLDAPGFVELRTGTAANVPAGAFYSVDPDRVTLNTPSSGFTYDHFFYPYAGSFTHNTWGSAIALEVSPYINDSTTTYGSGGPGVDGYGELYGLGIHYTAARLGALVGGVETVMAIKASKQGRTSAYSAFVRDDSSYESYAGVFGGIGGWQDTGTRLIWLDQLGNHESGTAIQIYGGTQSFRRVFNYHFAGVDYFNMDKRGNIALGGGVGNALGLSNTTGNLTHDARINLATGASDPASGIMFGPDVTGTVALFRPAVNALQMDGMDAASNASFRINALTGRSASLRFYQDSVAYWSVRKETDNTFKIEDVVNTKAVFVAVASATGDVRLAPEGGRVMVGVNSAAATSASLEISSSTGALLLSRMTTTQRDALTAVNGMALYNSTTADFEGRKAGAWVSLTSGGGGGGGSSTSLLEGSTPSAVADTAILFAQAHPTSGRTQLMVQFGTGSPQVLATE